jgi:hypothetical protein
MPNTTNLQIPLLSVAQTQKEVSVNVGLTALDGLLSTGILRGTLASRPAASWPGRLYFATDAGNESLSFDDGAAWHAVTFDANLLFTGEGLSVSGHLNFAGGTAPTAAAGANAGTGPPAPVVFAGSNDTRGRISFGTGTAPASGSMVVVTFAAAYTTAPFVILTPTGGATANLVLFVQGPLSTTSFNVSVSNTPAASQTNGFYSCDYWIPA